MIVLYFLGYFYQNKQNSYAALIIDNIAAVGVFNGSINKGRSQSESAIRQNRIQL